ncbi:Uncharacterized protein OBRU01_00405 [Operophtera brumata]|uniref:Uncharacterized protein n=1 Tax=Operophtera brumata TaxID=104452 RepID=A0A0L7LRE0_OPEBR|nr:Uncharacterized protein OBRU01_00405 [Operophtera brumata]
MPMPALRRPKVVLSHEKAQISLPRDKNYVIITLKGDRKLVVTEDSYNGILSMGGVYKCVFCDALLALQQAAKVQHISSLHHSRTLEKYPHVDEFSHHLIRKVSGYWSFYLIIV